MQIFCQAARLVGLARRAGGGIERWMRGGVYPVKVMLDHLHRAEPAYGTIQLEDGSGAGVVGIAINVRFGEQFARSTHGP